MNNLGNSVKAQILPLHAEKVLQVYSILASPLVPCSLKVLAAEQYRAVVIKQQKLLELLE